MTDTQTDAPERMDLPQAFADPECTYVWFGVDGLGKAWWRFDVVMDGAATASYAVLPDAHKSALDARDATIAALVEALEKAEERLNASNFINAEHGQAGDIIRAAIAKALT